MEPIPFASSPVCPPKPDKQGLLFKFWKPMLLRNVESISVAQILWKSAIEQPSVVW